MVQLRYIGNNKPSGMVIDIEEKRVEVLLDSGEWEKLIKDLTDKPKTELITQPIKKYDNSKRTL